MLFLFLFLEKLLLMKKIIFLSLLLTFHILLSTSFAQDNKKIDSLKNVLKTLPALNGTEADTMRMKISNNIGRLFQNTNLDSAYYWYLSVVDTINISGKIKQSQIRSYYNAITLRNVGAIYYLKNKYLFSIKYFELSLDVFEKLNKKNDAAKCLNNIGLAYRDCDYFKSVLFIEKSLKYKKEIGDKLGASNCLITLGSIAVDRGDYLKGIAYLEDALKIDNDLNEKNLITKCLGNLGLAYSLLGDYNNAIKYQNISLKLSEELMDQKQISSCILSLGIIYSKQGSISKAIEFIENSLKISQSIGDKRLISGCTHNLGVIYQNQGNYLKAFNSFEIALKYAEESNDKGMIVLCLNNIGGVFENQSEYTKATEYYERSLKICEQLGDKDGISDCYLNLGHVLYNQLDYLNAKPLFEKSLAIFNELGDERKISICLMYIGDVLTHNKDYSNAIKYFQQSIDIQLKNGRDEDLAANFYNLADTYVSQKLYKNATPFFLNSVQIKIELIQKNFSTISEKEKEMFLQKTSSVFFNTLNEFALMTKADSVIKQCYDNELLLKGLLLSSSGALLSTVSESNDTALTNAYWKLKMYRDRISKLYSTPKDDRKESIDSLQNLANNEERKLVKLSSEFADIQNLFTYKWEEVQKNLSKDEAAIEFVRINNKLRSKNDSATYAAFILRPRYQPEMVSLFDEKQMQQLIKKQDTKGGDFIASLYSRGVKPLNSNIQPSGDSLYAMIWKPMLPYLKGVKTIYYAPAGMLHQIAFSAIANSKDSLISDIYDLRCVASTSVLINDKTKEEKPKTISLFGGIAYDADTTQIKNLAIKYQNKDDLAMARSYSLDSIRGGNWNFLPGTLKEVQDIKALSEKQNITTTFYSAENATEESFKSMSGKASPDIIHIATHGFFFPNIEKKEKRMGEESVYRMNEDPLFRSGLLFSGANYAWKGRPIAGIEDGILTAYEVGNLNLKNTKLVVLSACETGLGDIKGSEGVYGLQRAFKMAGVKYIIMSLWQVPDKETSEFMKLFYANWFKNGDIRKSFTETQREMRKKYAPYYWAAFVLVE
jgi:CHAT domain-containing protein/uncharacterized protein HemY